MSDVVTVNGSSEYTYNDQIVSIVSGSATINGGADTVQSSVSGVGITLLGNQETAAAGPTTPWLLVPSLILASGGLSSPRGELQHY